MIISTDVVAWLLKGRVIDDKTILSFAKLKNIEISDSLRKNLSNSFLKKHVQSKTTNDVIKSFFKELIPIDSFHKEIDQLDASTQIKISSLKDSLSLLESGYSKFFEAAKLDDSFVRSELRKIFQALYDLVEQQENGISDEGLEIELFKYELFQQLDLKNDLYIDHGVKEIIHKQFSLNILLYLCACLDLNEGRRRYSTFQEIFETLIPDIGDLRSPFFYFVLLIRDFHSRNGNELSSEKISELLDIEPKSFSRYIKGTRKVHLKHMDSIMVDGGFIYFYIVFWGNFLERFSKNNEILVTDFLNKYPQYYEIALLNFEKFKI